MGFRLRERRAGAYLGTVVKGDWEQRDDSKRLEQPGQGEWMMDDYGLVFYRRESRIPIVIPYADMVEVGEGPWKVKGWEREQAVIINWVKGAFMSTFPRVTDGRDLSSGFVLASEVETTRAIIEHIRSNILDLSGK